MKVTFSNGIFLLLTMALAFQFGCKQKKEGQKVIKGPQIITSSKSGIDINYTVHSQGDHALFFIHGWSCDQTYWEKQVPYFKKNYKVVTLDLGGHGKSGKNRTDWTMEAFGSDVIDVINATPFKKLSIIGHSMGSVVALNVATRIEKQPLSVVFVDFFKDKPSLPPTKEEAEKRIAAFRTDFVNSTTQFVRGMFLPTSDPTLVIKTANHMASADPQIATEAVMNMMMNDSNAGFETLVSKGIHAHIINSDRRPTNTSYFDSLGFKVHTLKETAHFLMIEKPQEFNDLLKEIVSDKRK